MAKAMKGKPSNVNILGLKQQTPDAKIFWQPGLDTSMQDRFLSTLALNGDFFSRVADVKGKTNKG